MKVFDEKGYVSKEVFDALEQAWTGSPPAILADSILDALSDLIRYNTILSAARAGTGHLGASLSIIDILTCIYYMRFKFNPKRKNANSRDIFVLSKGHAVPALYGVLAAKGYIEIEELDKLRRLGGLQGHCDISTAGIEANTGSLAMGLSRAIGYAIAKKRMELGGNVIAIVGDGELQEGQIWEALMSAVSFELSNLYIVIDNNKVQTDQYVSDIVKYNNLCKTLESMGFAALEMCVTSAADAAAGFDALDALDKHANKPKVLIADTIKGQGISFMEHRSCLKKASDRYVWHNKAPDIEEMEGVYYEIFARVKSVLKQLGAMGTGFPNLEIPKKTDEQPVEGEPLTPAFSKALLSAGENEKIVVFDADLEADCGLTRFRNKYPERFFEMGIMEQHTVSSAAAFARMGYFPVINSYTAFLTSRANEQIYNYASEGNRGLFAGHMSGIIPATPGKSHQAYRDIACMKNIPGMTIYQPATPTDCTEIMGRIFKGELGNIVYLRLSMVPPAVKLKNAPKDLAIGKSYTLKSGKDAMIIGVGPVVLGECLLAAQALENDGVSVEVRSHPWLNIFDSDDVAEVAAKGVPILIVEDHYKNGGFGEGYLAALSKASVAVKAWHIAIDGFTTTGMRTEILKHFGLDNDSIAQKLLELKKWFI